MPAALADAAARLPAGRWQRDTTHSTAGFAVKHTGVATFRSRLGGLALANDVKLELGLGLATA